MNAKQQTYLAARRTDYGSNHFANDSSFRGRKENVNIQVPSKTSITASCAMEISGKQKLPVNNGMILHKRKSSFIPKEKANLAQSQTQIPQPMRIESKALCELRFDANTRTMSAVEETTTDIERQGINAMKEYGEEVEIYQKELEKKFLPEDCLQKHEITMSLRAKMVDWMVEVLTNFKCNDQTFFMSVNLMDRYLKEKKEKKLISELHLIGVTSMFLASKYEDILPLRMDMVHEKIAHGKLSPESIRVYEQDMLVTLEYILQAPTVLEFLKRYCKTLVCPSDDKSLIEKMSLYLAKMSLHDYYFCSVKPSKIAISSIYVALKICEQLKKRAMLTKDIIEQMTHISDYPEETIVECAQKILANAQNFDTLFPGLTNLKKTHFTGLMDYIPK